MVFLLAENYFWVYTVPMHKKESQKYIGIKQSQNNSSERKIRSDSSDAVVLGLLHSNKEIWKIIDGYSDYAISNFGRIKNIRKNKIRKSTKGNNGYMYVTLYLNKKTHSKTVHRLVAIHFLKNKREQVNHKDGNKTNNKIENLEWVTRSENQLHCFKIGLNNHRNERNTKAKLSFKDAIKIRKLNKKMNQKDIGKIFGVLQPAISAVINNRTWKI